MYTYEQLRQMIMMPRPYQQNAKPGKQKQPQTLTPEQNLLQVARSVNESKQSIKSGHKKQSSD